MYKKLTFLNSCSIHSYPLFRLAATISVISRAFFLSSNSLALFNGVNHIFIKTSCTNFCMLTYWLFCYKYNGFKNSQHDTVLKKTITNLRRHILALSIQLSNFNTQYLSYSLGYNKFCINLQIRWYFWSSVP